MFELFRGKESYLSAIKNMDIDDLNEYLKHEEKEELIHSEALLEIQKNASTISVLESLYVGINERRNGYATDMLQEYLRKVKNDCFVLLAEKSNDNEFFKIQNFYKAHGFVVIDEDDILSVMYKKNWN